MVPLGGLGPLKPFDDVRSTEVAQSGLVLGLAHLDHPDEVAFEVTAVDELEQFCAGEPAVDQKIIESDSLNDGPAEHLDGIGNLGLEHFLFADVDLLILATLLAILSGLLFLGKPLWLVGILAGLGLYGGVQHQLRLAVRIAEEHGLKAQDAFHHRVRKHLSKALSLASALRKVGVIQDETARGTLGISPAADKTDQLAVDRVKEAAPVNTSVIHQAIERVLLAGEQLAKGAVGIGRRSLDGKERIQNEQFHQLNEGELAVRILDRSHRFCLYDEPFHHVVYRVDCPAGVVVLEIIFEFRDYLSIFVHG